MNISEPEIDDLPTDLPLTAQKFTQTVLDLDPRVAVFDCDGTLWGGDSGSGFMRWSMECGLLSRDASDWMDNRYRSYLRGEVDEHTICAEMVQIYKGLSDHEVRSAAGEYFRLHVEKNIFPEMLSLVETLRHRGAEVWAVSSTNHWVVEEGMRRFAIPANRVLAACVRVTNGIVTDEILDVPTDEGKARALRNAGRAAPDAVFGNSVHDAAMLTMARSAFAVNPSRALAEIAAQAGWPVYHPIAKT